MNWKGILTGSLIRRWSFFALAEMVLPETMLEKHIVKRGPKIVVIGGGTGLATLLRGLKKYTSNNTAIVTVFDDGGSSGRLRGELGILPPGDIRNCLVALAEKESSMEQLFSYRFQEGSGLKGHNLGNLLIAAMTDIKGDFAAAIQEISRVLAVRGTVLPATLSLNKLCAELVDGSIIEGECNFGSAEQPIRTVYMSPDSCQPLDSTLKAIAEADLIMIGPGSLYTSVIPNLLVEGIPEALRNAKAQIGYVCNIMTQKGETDNYTVSDHIQALIDYGSKPNFVIANKSLIPEEHLARYRVQKAFPVKLDSQKIAKQGVRLISANLVDLGEVVRHDITAVAQIIVKEALHLKKKS